MSRLYKRIKDNPNAHIIDHSDPRYESIDPGRVYKQVIIGAKEAPKAGIVRVGDAFYEVHDGRYSPSLNDWAGSTTYGIRWKRS